jgi:hypothetical protein
LLATTFSAGVNGTASFRQLVSPNGAPVAGTVAGVLVNRHALPVSRVVVVAAGCLSYFARRNAIDMLGKSDRHVARVPEVRGGPTGHNRFDIEWTLRDRADIIASFGPQSLAMAAGSALGAAGASSARDYGAALVSNAVFVKEYRGYSVPVAFLQKRGALFVHERSLERDRLQSWREPVVTFP